VYERDVRRAKPLAAVALIVAVAIAVWFETRRPFPSDRTPEGAYLRIALGIDEGRVRDVFPYLETDAQWAAFTIRDARAKASALVRASYPKGQGEDLLKAYGPLGDTPDGANAFAWIAAQRGFVAQLRRDLSGVAKVDLEGERASVVTVRGTRYAFRKRDNGMWGLTLFTAQLLAEADRASRDLAVVTAAAEDYDRAPRP
jgi:hypothetical protein